jgi:hypothetical protein
MIGRVGCFVLAVVGFSSPACRTRISQRAATATATAPDVGVRSHPASVASESGARSALLGRIVDLDTFQAVATLDEPPDEEVTSPVSDVAVLRSSDWQINAYRLSDGVRLWYATPEAPCRNLLVRGSKVYSGCGDKIVARAIDSGHVTVIDPGPGAGNPVLTAHSLISPHDRGRIDVYDIETGRRRVSRILPELSRAFHEDDVLASPSSDGICVLGLVSLAAKRLEYRAACYDEQLVPRWRKTLPMRLPRDPLYDVRQVGPRFVVFDDQWSIDHDQTLDRGRGAILRWRDGELTPLDDRTFATVEDSAGERIPTREDDIFHRAHAVGTPTFEGIRQAQVVSDDRRAFALIDNRGLALGGIDRETGRTLFVVPVPTSDINDLHMANGLPAIRSRWTSRWMITVYDPSTGKVLYQDTRHPPVRR